MNIVFGADEKDRSITTFSTDSTKQSKSNYTLGKLYGVSEKWIDSTQLEYSLTFSNDILNGRSVFFYENGNKKSEGQFTNGKKVNSWIFYNDDGVISKETKHNQ